MNRILIIGGYGHVGQKIARRLIAAGRAVTLAGRDGAKARAVAARLGCDGVALDLARPESWAGPLAEAGVVICCLDTTNADLAGAVLARGGRYLDISATDEVLRRIEALGGEGPGLAVLSLGLAPGLTNLMVREAQDRCPEARRFRIGILLGLGDSHGPAAIDWTLATMEPVGRDAIRPLRFGQDRRALPTIPFDFADQHSLMRRGYGAVETRLALASPLMTGWTLRLLTRLAARPRLRRLLARSMPVLKLGSDRAALVVEAFVAGRAAPVLRLTLEGREEAEITALVAAEVALRVEGTAARGVRHLDELLRLEELRPALAGAGVVIGEGGAAA